MAERSAQHTRVCVCAAQRREARYRPPEHLLTKVASERQALCANENARRG